VNLDAGEGCAVALAAGLGGLELVESVVELAGEVGLVADDVVEVGVLRKEVGRLGRVERLGRGGRQRAVEAAGLGEAGFDAGALARDAGLLRLGIDDELALDGGDAAEAPEELGGASGELRLERPFGGEAGDGLVEEVLPVLLVLEAGDDDGGGTQPVAQRVPAGDGLAVICVWHGPHPLERRTAISVRSK
jgi:hypothetical protein